MFALKIIARIFLLAGIAACAALYWFGAAIAWLFANAGDALTDWSDKLRRPPERPLLRF